MGKEVNFQVIKNDILVKIPTVEKMTAAGIIKSDAQLVQEQAKLSKFLMVERVGAECKYIKEGDRIYPSGGQHPQIVIDDKPYAIINESAVLGKRID